MSGIEQTIVNSLVTNQKYFAQVIPHLKSEYFSPSFKLVVNSIRDYAEKYKKVPTKTALKVEADKLRGESGELYYDDVVQIIGDIHDYPEDYEWLVDETEKFCQDMAAHNAVLLCHKITENATKSPTERDKRLPDRGAIIDIMKDAVSVCFDTSVGHDYFEDWGERWERYTQKVDKIPFSIRILNKVTDGGVERKTLNLIMTGVNVGKSMGMCSLAADYLTLGYNVLYISLEMSEDAVAKRVDANLLDVPLQDFDRISKADYESKFKGRIDKQKAGRLYIKQYPTGIGNVNHFTALLNELRMKKNFVPDVVFIDYLGICGSTRLRSAENTYLLQKSIAEELRGFAIENNLAVWTGVQTSRGAWGASDINMEDIADSSMVAATADFMIAAMETEEMLAGGYQRFKQVKSRYGDKSKQQSFNIMVSKENQRWSDYEDCDQQMAAYEHYMENTQAAGRVASLEHKVDAAMAVGSGVPNSGMAPELKPDYSNVDLSYGEIDWS